MRGGDGEREQCLQLYKLPLQFHAHRVTVPRKVHIVITEMVTMLQIRKIFLVEMAITAITMDMMLEMLRTTVMILAWHAHMETC